ncbi:salicylate 1-monooxygenase [Clohesyomyces aquaticus]|uniref:Salicylate 1-monooxygenase n=1 Tax=Clohesyomyces aquaticus TaxID=1231657 RepID=A0A1Y1YJ03_9PLEO|nr:salicylate 1-monooxygenase [Clohesyomyces aquaticus]
MSERTKLRVAIVGAGIASLTAAIALKDRLRAKRHYKTNEIVSADRHNGHVEDRHLTSRYYRAHLQRALLEHVDSAQLHLGRSFLSVNFDDSIQRLIIHFRNGSSAQADLLLGSDGIHSHIRRQFVLSSGTKWTGWVTFHSVFPFSHVSHILDLPDEAAHFWGPDRTLFMSRLGENLFTFVGSYQSDPDVPGAPYKDSEWDSDGDVNVQKEYYKDWSHMIRAVVDVIPEWNRLVGVGNGRVTLASDAAHAHGGAFAAGGSLAIDDAWAFAESILHVFPRDATGLPSGRDIDRALRLYERTRKPHTDRVLSTVHAGNRAKIANIGKPETDAELRARMPSRSDPAWIHEHDLQTTLKKALQGGLGWTQIEQCDN